MAYLFAIGADADRVCALTPTLNKMAMARAKAEAAAAQLTMLSGSARGTGRCEPGSFTRTMRQGTGEDQWSQRMTLRYKEMQWRDRRPASSPST